MTSRHIVDAGPLVALLSVRDHHHEWAQHIFANLQPPLLSCEAVLAETWHLLRGTADGQDALLELMTTGIVMPDLSLKAELAAVRRLVLRYRDRPMSLADACLVRMCEVYDESSVITLDRDFSFYRKHGRRVIPIVSPFA